MFRILYNYNLLYFDHSVIISLFVLILFVIFRIITNLPPCCTVYTYHMYTIPPVLVYMMSTSCERKSTKIVFNLYDIYLYNTTIRYIHTYTPPIPIAIYIHTTHVVVLVVAPPFYNSLPTELSPVGAGLPRLSIAANLS